MTVNYNDESYDYTSYWSNRSYEHNCEVIALKKLLPKQGNALVDIGGGFGRLLPYYKDKFKAITILDASSKLLNQARNQVDILGLSNVAFKVDVLPFTNKSGLKSPQFDAALMVRVSHHLTDLDPAVESISKILVNEGVFVLEIANKWHFLNLVRNLCRLNFSVLSESPYKIGTFTLWSPKYVISNLEKHGFRVEEKLSVSNFRVYLLKRIIPEKILLLLENLLQKPLSYINFGPSIFIKAVKISSAV